MASTAQGPQLRLTTKAPLHVHELVDHQRAP